jgi:hypothetical protein
MVDVAASPASVISTRRGGQGSRTVTCSEAGQARAGVPAAAHRAAASSVAGGAAQIPILTSLLPVLPLAPPDRI